MERDDIKTKRMDAADRIKVGKLHEDTFGPGRFARTAYRVREGICDVSEHCQTAWRDDQLVGAVTMTHIVVGDAEGHWLLGPLAVHALAANKGLGQELVAAALESVGTNGAPSATVILVGDLAYYERLGFEHVPKKQIVMPGPVDPARLLIWRGADGKRTVPIGTVSAIQR